MRRLDLDALGRSRAVDLTVWPPRYDPAYRPAGGDEAWLPEVEYADPAARDELIFAKLGRQVAYAWERSAFYRRKWQEAGVSPETMDELLIRVEYAASHAAPDRLRALETSMRKRLRARLGVHPRLELVPEGTIPRTEFKARRVIDDRDLYRRGTGGTQPGGARP